MNYPGKEKYQELAKEYNLIPICKEIRADFETPISIFLKLNGKFLLESVEQGSNVGRYSIIGVGIKTEFKMDGEELEICEYLNAEKINSYVYSLKNPLLGVKEYLEKIKVAEYSSLPPFYGGLIGYLGYEAIQYFEKVPVKKGNDNIPDGYLIIPEVVFIFDVVKRNVLAVLPSEPGAEPSKTYEKDIQKLNDLCLKMNGSLPNIEYNRDGFKSKLNYLTPKENFIDSVNKCKNYIREGDIIQAVLSQRIEVATSADPFALYRTLRILNPSPYMFYLDFDDFKIIGSSPEVMVRVHNKEILLKPIAGTRIRGNSVDDDGKIAKELLNDAKEKAEHIMLVDLGRNDLGRVAYPGSVDVAEFLTVEKYSHVMHIVSTIKAELDKNYDVFDVLRATFPAGTLSGAPKIRAMEIIDELEPVKRGPYGGMILNLGFNLNLDSCITIRTIVLKDGIAGIQAGAGIVADSDPESEFAETMNKAMALLKTIELTDKGDEL
jgi:anthranilate synthase component I